ncbi:hypothetical protein [Mesobacillus maritimus]
MNQIEKVKTISIEERKQLILLLKIYSKKEIDMALRHLKRVR